jgi:hypothetical protein
LPRGCARLVASPAAIGSTPIHTMGMVPVAARAASTTWLEMATINIRIAAGDLASDIGKAVGPSLAGIPLDDQVPSLDIAQPTQLLEKRLIEATKQRVAAGFADDSDRTRRDDNRNPVLL